MGNSNSVFHSFLTTTVDDEQTFHTTQSSHRACCSSPVFTTLISPFSASQSNLVLMSPDEAIHHEPHESFRKEGLGLPKFHRPGWCDAMHRQQQLVLRTIEQTVEKLCQQELSDQFVFYLNLCLLRDHVIQIKDRIQEEIPYLREWVTFFISPLSSLDLIMETVQPGFSSILLQKLSWCQKFPEPFTTVAEWVHSVFPFITKTFVVEELDFITTYLGLQLYHQGNTHVFEIFFKKQLASFLENELDMAKKIDTTLKILDTLINKNLLRCRSQVKYTYITLMSERLLVENDIYLDDHVVALMFQRPLSDPGLGSLFQLTSTQLTNEKVVLKFLRFYSFSKKVIRPPNVRQDKENHRPFRFPPPPLPPRPSNNANQGVTLKLVEAFLHRCLVDSCFLEWIISQYKKDHPSSKMIELDCQFPSWLSPLSSNHILYERKLASSYPILHRPCTIKPDKSLALPVVRMFYTMNSLSKSKSI